MTRKDGRGGRIYLIAIEQNDGSELRLSSHGHWQWHTGIGTVIQVAFTSTTTSSSQRGASDCRDCFSSGVTAPGRGP